MRCLYWAEQKFILKVDIVGKTVLKPSLWPEGACETLLAEIGISICGNSKFHSW